MIQCFPSCYLMMTWQQDHQKKTHFRGKFSYIFPLASKLTLGCVHGSHLFHDDGIYHLGCTCRITVPLGAFILFNENLYHYGDVSVFNGEHVMGSPRLFAYVAPEYYVEPTRNNTHKMEMISACQEWEDCSTCVALRGIFKKVIKKTIVKRRIFGIHSLIRIQ